MSTLPTRGRHLAAADRHFATGGMPLARLLAPGVDRILDRIDAGLAAGAIRVVLPDGRRRMLGGHTPGPEAEVNLVSWRALARLAIGGSIGWYRAWAAGEWTSPDPVPLFTLFVLNRATLGDVGRAGRLGALVGRVTHWARSNSRARARDNVAFHYDLGNDFYAPWLDASMTYSSAIFATPDETLEAAQTRKLDAILDRLALTPGQRLLEIGCGWGSLAERAAQRGLTTTGITLSEEQRSYAAARLGHRATIRLEDYREATGGYDGVASVEMVEAVGADYWPAFMTAVAAALRPGGRAAIQYIAIDDDIFDTYASHPDFIQAYIFPGGMLISERRFRAAAEAAGLVWQDRRGFGSDYAETLRRWRERFDAAVREGRLPAAFDDAFVGLWRYYLMYCEGGFRGGGIDMAQVTLVKSA